MVFSGYLAKPEASAAPDAAPAVTLFTLLKRSENRGTVNKLLGTSVMMLLVPLCTYFSCHEFLLPLVGITTRLEVWSAVATLFATNTIMAIYAISAFQENDGDEDEAEHEHESDAAGSTGEPKKQR